MRESALTVPQKPPDSLRWAIKASTQDQPSDVENHGIRTMFHSMIGKRRNRKLEKYIIILLYNSLSRTIKSPRKRMRKKVNLLYACQFGTLLAFSSFTTNCRAIGPINLLRSS